MMSKQSTLKIIVLVVGGAVLNVGLLAFSGWILERKFDLREHFLEAQRSPAASAALADAFRAKDVWADLLVIPIVGCLIGAYAGLVRGRKPALFAVGCLMPVLLYEIMTEPVQGWSAPLKVRYFGMRVLGFLLAMLVAASLRGFLDKGVSSA